MTGELSSLKDVSPDISRTPTQGKLKGSGDERYSVKNKKNQHAGIHKNMLTSFGY